MPKSVIGFQNIIVHFARVNGYVFLMLLHIHKSIMLVFSCQSSLVFALTV